MSEATSGMHKPRGPPRISLRSSGLQSSPPPLQETPMPVPKHIFDPPFNIIRASHVVLEVTDLDASRKFYETAVGLHVEDSDNGSVYLRGSEEHQHHSLVLRRAATAACSRLGFKVGNEHDLDKAAAFLAENGILY